MDSVGINRREVVNEMKESHRKGVANHSDLDPCEGVGNGGLEALGRGTCRLRPLKGTVRLRPLKGTVRLGIPEVDELRNSQNQ